MKYVKLYEEFVLQELEDEYNIELDLYDNGDYMTLSKLVVSPDDRKGGVGTEVMNKICQYADEIGRDIYNARHFIWRYFQIAPWAIL